VTRHNLEYRVPVPSRNLALGLALSLVLLSACPAPADEQSLVVGASAYNSLAAQTNDKPNITAWGDVLEPGMKSIAVSRDLIALGLGHGAEVSIDGLPGRYKVLDKMAKRWTKKIDIYMGEDAVAAREWGVREVTIRWSTPEPN
jgi:3D (Asp-Asp-Asp) domain-containing protein